MSGLYIHIPFCRSKCFYCDFFSTASAGDMDFYAEALMTEWSLRKGELQQPVKTIYLGGGTPSLMPTDQISRLIGSIASGGVDIDALEEFTIEANPEDITAETIEGWRRIGINRISIGIQSFDERELASIGRRHSSEASVKALQCLAGSGINYSADLIYGLPGQSLDDWERNLDTLLRFRPPHLSAYLLSYEPRTRLYAMLEKGTVTESDEQLATQMYELLCRKTGDAGYRHYEISNFALPGMEARHNSAYWDYTEYLGLGCSAHSFTGEARRANPANIRGYVDSMRRQAVCAELDEETEEDRLNDYIITSLRTSKGFRRAVAERRFSPSVMNKFDAELEYFLENNKQKGGLRMNDNGDISISENMWLMSDAIMRELIVE